MPTIKIANPNNFVSISGITSSNVSSSLSGNMKLIQSQITNKNVNYINVKNAVRLLENYSNWNGYIKLYTEVQSNFEVDDIVYITYFSGSTSDQFLFDLSNPLEPDEGGNRFYLGYKILYVNSYKNEIVINRHYNDIGIGRNISNQYLSKVSCRGGDLFDNISDGVVFYNCNILNSGFGTMMGIVKDESNNIISGVTLLCSGLRDISDSNGNYSLNVPIGDNLIKYSAPGYITSGITVTMSEFLKLSQDIVMTSGENSITITSDKINNEICVYDIIQFDSTNIGYDQPVKYQWVLTRLNSNINIGNDNPKITYLGFQSGDTVKCVVTDGITTSTSNILEIKIKNSAAYINTTINSISSSNITGFTINYGTNVRFDVVSICYNTISFEWKVNNITKSYNSYYESSVLENNDKILCIVSGQPIPAYGITATVNYTQISLYYNSTPYSSCFLGSGSIYYINGSNFSLATKIYKDSIGTLADSGCYSLNYNYRIWDKTIKLLYPLTSLSSQTILYTGNSITYSNSLLSCSSTYSGITNYYTEHPIEESSVKIYTSPDTSNPLNLYNGNNLWICVKLNDSGSSTSIQVDTSGIVIGRYNCP